MNIKWKLVYTLYFYPRLITCLPILTLLATETSPVVINVTKLFDVSSPASSNCYNNKSDCDITSAYLYCIEQCSMHPNTCKFYFTPNAEYSFGKPQLRWGGADYNITAIELYGNSATITSTFTSSDTSRLIYVDYNSTRGGLTRFYAEKLNIQNFSLSTTGEGGGAIKLIGVKSVELYQVSFKGNSVIKGFGGALYFDSNGFNNIKECIFDNNTALTAGAIYFFQYNNNSRIGDCEFTGNIATSDGGAVVLYQFNHGTQFINSSFVRNIADQNGGAVCFYNNNSAARFTGNSWVRNNANNNGGAVYFYRFNDYSEFVDQNFTNNFAKSNGSAVYLNQSNIKSTYINSSFTENNAYSGSVYLFQNNNDLKLIWTSFTRNFASSRGGGVYFWEYNIYASFIGVNFIENRANSHGGGVYLNNYNTYASFIDCRWIDGYAYFGGGIFLLSGSYNNSYLRLINSSFTNISCIQGCAGYLSGSYAFVDNVIVEGMKSSFCCAGLHIRAPFAVVSNSIFRNNRGWWANGLYITFGVSNLRVSNCVFDNNRNTLENVVAAGFGIVKDSSNVSITDSVFVGNTGFSGGAVSIGIDCNNITINRCKFSSNSAYKVGGAIYVQSSNNNVSIIDSVFEKNHADLDGGAIYIERNISYVVMTNVSLVENTAGRDGGALYLLISISNVFLAGCNFRRNVAVRDGGGFLLGRFIDQFTVYDLNAHKDFQIIETPHPFIPLNSICTNSTIICTPQLIFAQNYSMTTGTNILIVFDPQSATSDVGEKVNIYDSYLKQKLLFTNKGLTGWPGSDMPALKLAKDHFYIELIGTDQNNILKYGYYGFRIYVYPYNNLPSLSSTSNYIGNIAGRYGGSGAIYYQSLSPAMLNAFLEGNTAGFGGSFYYEALNNGVVIQSCYFTNNKAINDGGSLYLSASNFGVSIEDSKFFGNIAYRSGGGLFAAIGNGNGWFIVHNEIIVSRVSLYNNTAQQGGALFVLRRNNISFDSVKFIENKALIDGGGMYFDKENEAYINNVILSKNSADQRGGGVSSIEDNVLIIENISCVSNKASYSGGAMIVLNDSDVTFSRGPITFEDNQARLGGALVWQSSKLWELETNITIKFQRNKAVIGSAIAFADIYHQDDRHLHNLELRRNVASSAGTVYWLYNPESTSQQEPKGLNDSSNIWLENEAPYAVKYGTQTVSITNPLLYNVEVYDSKLTPPISFDYLDYYGVKVFSDNTTLTEASVVAYDCFGKSGLISGELILNPVDGTITYDDMLAFCFPNGNLTIKFMVITVEYRFFDLLYPWRYTVSNISLFNFRPCLAGERLIQGACMECIDSYLLNFNPDTQICETCPVEAEKCHGSTISLNPGYWRRSNVSDALFDCAYGSSACIGGNATGDDLCAEGYVGVLCQTCATNYFLNSESLICEVCGGLNVFTPTVILTILTIFLTVFGFAYYKYRKLSSENKKHAIQTATSPADSKCDDGNNIKKTSLMAYWEERYSAIMSKVKVITSTFQIVSASSSVLQIKMPGSFTTFMRGLKLLDFNIISIMPVSCVYRTDYVDTLMFSTLWPLMFGALLFVIFVGQFLWERRILLRKLSTLPLFLSVQMNRLSERLKVKYFNLFLLLTYFVLPSVTTSIFAMFPCMNVDPEGVDDLDDYYLIADTSISCSSPRYFMGVTLATIFILIYPIGIPALYFYLLYKKKREIQSRDNPNPRSLRSSVKMLEFLYKSYKPSAWYFEVVETFRRLFLTAFISVIAAGTPAQAILAMVATFIFMEYYGAVNPFPSDDERLMSKAGQLQALVTFLAALIIQNNHLGISANDSIGVLLILVNIGVLVLSVYFEVRSIRKTRADKTNGEKAEKREFSSDGKSDITLLEHSKDTLNPMAKLQGNSIELIEIVSRTKSLDAKNCDQDSFIKIEER